MVAQKFAPFGGMIPAFDDTLLPNTAAARAENTWLFDGSLRGMFTAKLLHTCADVTAARAFRLPNNYTDRIHIEDAIWLEFLNADTDVIRSTVVGDQWDRYYWASTSDVPRYNTRDRIKTGDPAYKLGVPNPDVAPVVVASGGTSTVVESRAYVYTWVSAYGEEGPPSPPTVLNGKKDDTWGLTLVAAAASDLGVDRVLTKTRIYRTVTGSDGTATYFLVDEIPIGQLTYNDTKADTVVSVSSSLESTTWTGPPSDLQGWVTMPNGMVAGFRDKEVWFCEPYRMHAWPAQYTLVVDFPIVGLGVQGTSLVVCTRGSPYLMYGADPTNLTQVRLPNIEPCMSRGSIVSRAEGVYYASPNGLMCVTYGSVTNITRQAIPKDKWQQLMPAATLYAAQLGDSYYGFGSARFGVFDTDAFDTSSFAQYDFSQAYVGALQAADASVALSVLTSDLPVACVWNDAFTGELFIMKEGKVYWLDVSDEQQPHDVFLWRSKLFQTDKSQNLGAMKVFFDVPAGNPPQNAERNTDPVQTLDEGQYGIIRIYADGRLITTRELRVSGELMRIESGFKADWWQVEIEGRVIVKNVQLASSARELGVV